MSTLELNEIPGATWSTMSYVEAQRLFSIEEDDVELLLDNGMDPSTLVHRGDLVVDGSVSLYGTEDRLCVIDGDLTVNGALVFKNEDFVYPTLLVTGSVTADNLACR